MPAIPATTEIHRCGRFEVRAAERQLLIDQQPAKLGARAFDVLLALVERRERLVSKDELLDLVWPDVVVEENNLQVQISTLRKLLGPQAIATVPGRGYRFSVPVDGAQGSAPPAPLAAPSYAGAVATPPVLESIGAAPALATTGNLPRLLPLLYGRKDDLSALQALLQEQRLVTLVGAGGIGKSRLALAAAHAERERWADGVWLIELASLSDPALVSGAVAQTLGVALPGRQGADYELANALQSKSMLLVLDNCEHLLQAAGELTMTLLARTAGVKLLATSQEPLHATDEQQFRVQPLAVPTDSHAANTRDFGALALFEGRARTADPRFQLNERNLPAVIEICRRLDGLPLAIELAAARVPLLGAEGVRDRLDDRFRVLTAGARFGLRRHQTLRATIEWSYSLLGADEQAVLRRLGVFTGSFGLVSAQAVAAFDRVDEWAVLDHLGALVDKSLVVAEAGEEPRYRLLETGRAWSIEKLAEAGEMETALQRHARAVLAVFERSNAERWTVLEHVRLERYLPDLDNARAALDWAAANAAESDLQIALAGAAAWIWNSVAQRPEGMRRSEQALARVTAATPPALEARLLAAWSQMAYPRFGAAERAAGERAVELYRTLGDQKALYVHLFQHGTYLARSGEFAQAERGFAEAAALHDETWPSLMQQPAIYGRANLCWMQGRHEEVLALSEEHLRLAAALGDSRLVLRSLIHLEQAASSLGRLEEAVARGRDLLARIKHERFVGSIAIVATGNLSSALTELGQLDEALQLARAAFPLAAQADLLLSNLDPFALLAFKRGRIANAARVLGRTEAQYAIVSNRREPNEQRMRDSLFAALREALPAAELECLFKEGAALSNEEAGRLALED